jgi:PadR family transcriptional regulator, regulatory protein PadR
MPRAEDTLPLTQTTFYILASLIDGPKHGYAVSKDIEARSDGTVRLAIGNLYIALKRLLEDGLIERAGDQEREGERRKVYKITGLGETVFAAETQRLRQMMRAIPGATPAWLGA